MAKTIKSLLGLSMMIRNLRTLNNYTTKQFIQTSANSSTRYNKESLVSPRPHLATGIRPCLLLNSKKQTNVFHIIQTNSTEMSASDAILALEILFNVVKNKPEDRAKMKQAPEFLTLCEILKKNINHLTTIDAVNMLKALVYFYVPSTSVIVQVVLQFLRRSLNDLSLAQIEFIYFLLSDKCQKTPLVDALVLALPLVHETNVLLKLNRENIQSIAMSLKFLSKKTVNKDVFAVLIEAINNCQQPIEPLMARTILWSLCDLKCFPEGLPDIVNSVQNILAQNITSLDKETVKNLIGLVSYRVKHRARCFYHEGFADACASVVISDDWGFTDAIYVLKNLRAMNHIHISLLDYIAAKCFEEPMILKECPLQDIEDIVASASDADYKPVFWDVMHESVIRDRVLHATSLDSSVFNLAANLASLDCYYPELLKRIFTSNLTSLSVMPSVKQRKLLILYQAVKSLYPQYTGPWPTESIPDINSLNVKLDGSRFPLTTSLECALGGHRYVLTNARSKLGHYIAHVLVMRKGGFPVAINNETSTDTNEYPVVMIEELQPPADSQVILILYIPERAYSQNTQRMKGLWSLRIKSLEVSTGHTVIPIKSTTWKGLSESDKIPYLMHAIKLKCSEISVSANS